MGNASSRRHRYHKHRQAARGSDLVAAGDTGEVMVTWGSWQWHLGDHC